MLERRRHAGNLGWCEAKAGSLVSPLRNCLAYLPYDQMGLTLVQFEIAGDLECQLQRRRTVVKIDGGG